MEREPCYIYEPSDGLMHLLSTDVCNRHNLVVVTAARTQGHGVVHPEELAMMVRKSRHTESWFRRHLHCFSEEKLVDFEDLVNAMGYQLSIRMFRDKKQMKDAWMSAGLPTPRYQHLRTGHEPEQWVIQELGAGRGIVAKPATGMASCGVRKLASIGDLQLWIGKIHAMNRVLLSSISEHGTTGVLLEEYIDGQEYSVDTVWRDGYAVVHFGFSRNRAEGSFFPDRLYYVDASVSDCVGQSLQAVVARAGETLGVDTGVTHTELIVDRRGNPHLIEMACRPGAGGAFYRVFGEAYGLDVLELYLQQFCPETICPSGPRRDDGVYYWYNFGHEIPGRVQSVHTFSHPRSRIVEQYMAVQAGSSLPSPYLATNYYYWIMGHVPDQRDWPEVVGALEQFEWVDLEAPV